MASHRRPVKIWCSVKSVWLKDLPEVAHICVTPTQICSSLHAQKAGCFHSKCLLLLFTVYVSAWIIRGNASRGERSGGKEQLKTREGGPFLHRGRMSDLLDLYRENWKDVPQSVWLLVRDDGCFLLVGEVGPAALHLCTAVPHMSFSPQVAVCFLGMANLCLCLLWQL